MAYYDSSKVIAKSLKILKPTIQNQTTLSENSFLFGYFDKKPYHVRQLQNFQYGSLSEDFKFDKDSYLQFSFITGLNDAPPEHLSMMLIVIIVVGTGLPFLLFIVGVIYTIIRKTRTSNYDNIIE